MAQQNDLRMRGNTAIDVPDLPGTIHPFKGNNRSFFTSFTRELSNVLLEKQGKKIIGYSCLNVVVTTLLLIWCSSTNSMALTAFTYITMFDAMYLLTCLVTIWVHKQKPSPVFSFGYERFEVLAVFASTILAMLGSFFIIKESVERMVVQPDIHTGRLLVGTAVGLCWHLILMYIVDNKCFNHVVAASTSSWLQEHVSDISQSICHVVPGLSKLLLPRINPFALIGFAGATAIILVHILIDVNNAYGTDTWAAVWISVMTCGTMFPMSVYTGKILLQTTPSHIIGQLDKCLREASTLDGVLEFRNEHFWTLGFGTMSGSVHVRVRRDADEQLVLAHVSNRLSNLISVLTVHIFKDDWTRPSTFQILGDTSLFPKKGTTPMTSSSPSGISSPGRAPSPEGTYANSVYRLPVSIAAPLSPPRQDPGVAPGGSTVNVLDRTNPLFMARDSSTAAPVQSTRTPASQLLLSNSASLSKASGLGISLGATAYSNTFSGNNPLLTGNSVSYSGPSRLSNAVPISTDAKDQNGKLH